MKNETKKRAFLMVSLGSRIINSSYLDYLYNKLINQMESLGIIFLDELEISNLVYLDNIDEAKARKRVYVRCQELIAGLNRNKLTNLKYYYWKEFSKNPSFQNNLTIIQNEYNNNSSFKKHCHNQTFINLQPLLLRRNITKNSHELVGKLSNYIRNEIALKLFIGNQNLFDIEIAPKPEMEIVNAIYDKKYSNISQVISNRISFEVIPPDQNINSIELHNICFKYPEKDFSIVDFNLQVNSGKIFGLLGKNASGKTTILKILGGHLAPQTGRIYLGGNDITKIQAMDRPIATVFQELALFPHLNVLDNVAFGLIAGMKVNKKTAKDISEKYLEENDLIDYANMKPNKLSLGIKQRVAITRALATDPRVLLLDEPTASLDFYTRSKLIDIIRQISDKFGDTTIIIVSHDKDFILSVCNNAAIIDKGQLIAQGNPQDLCLNPSSRWLAEYLESGNIIQGKLDNENNFTSLNGDIKLKVKMENTCDQGKDCVLLIKLDALSIENKNNDSLLFLPVKLIRSTSKTHSIELTYCTENGDILIMRISHKKYKINIHNLNSTKLFINPEECILLKS